jgi:hypothetical protein
MSCPYSAIQFLYEAQNGDSPVYNVDQALFNYRYVEDDPSKFTAIYEPASYFTPVNSFKLLREDPTDVSARVAIYPQTSYTDYSAIANTTTFNSSVYKNEYVVSITKNLNGILDASKILNNIANNINISTNDPITRSHSKMDQFMRNILLYTCYNNFNDALKLMTTLPSSTDPTILAQNFIVGNCDPNTVITLLKTTSNQVASKMKDLLNIYIKSGSPIPIDLMSDFKYQVNGTPYFNTPFYYKLRLKASNEIPMDQTIFTTSNASIQLVIKKILIDTYIKTCYPLLQYDFIDNMQSIYQMNGDFVNSRIAVLAKTAFTYNTFNHLYSLSTYSTTMNAATMTNGYSTYGDFKSTILGYLQDYITNMNNININSTNNTTHPIAVVAKDLQKKSDDVVNNNAIVQKLKDQISNNQLSMRNVLHNAEALQAVNNNKALIYTILWFVFIIMIILSTVFIILQKTDYVYYLCGAISAIIIIYSVLQAIYSFLTYK